jgi:hypothetical protein
MTGWFDVDRAGLAKLLHNKDRSFIINEVGFQNTGDEDDVTRVDITLEPVPGKPQARFTVIDDAPEGFNDLRHSWTLYADSYKKSDPTKRGFMNLGEKLALSLAIEAHIITTTGGVRFNSDETRSTLRKKREAGSEVSMLLRITRDQCGEIEAGARLVIPPRSIVYTFNGKRLPSVDPIASFPASLATVKADSEGNMARTTRNTTIEVYEPLTDDGGWLYEMGIPVVRTGDKWSVSIQQKVPLNMNRDNVTPAYLRRVRTLVLNHMADRLTENEASESWVKDATASKDIEADAYLAIMDKRFGEKRVMFDPSDPEAGMNAVSEGYTMVTGNQLSQGERDNMRRLRGEGSDPFQPAGRRFPSAKPYSTDPSAPPVKVIPKADWTDRQAQVVNYAKQVFKLLMGSHLTVRIVATRNNFAACYGSYQLDLNRTRLGAAWFNDTSPEGLQAVHDLLLHEFAHHGGIHHLDNRYYKACTHLGAKLTGLALDGSLKPKRYGFQTKRGDRPKKAAPAFTL